MSIFNDIAKAFGSKKAPSIEALERLVSGAEAALAAAQARLAELEAARADAILGGDEARAAHRAAIRNAEDDAADAEAALASVRTRLEAAKREAEEAERRAKYDAARRAQETAAAAVAAQYEAAAATLIALRTQVAEADALVEAANNDLPAGAERLPIEAESLVRDIQGNAREVLSSERVELWCGAGGAPLPPEDAARVRPRDGSTGALTVNTGFGSHAVQVHRATFDRQKVRAWTAPIYGSRLRDLEIPPLRPDAPPAPAVVEELVPVPAAIAAE